MKKLRLVLAALLCILVISCYKEDEYLPTNINPDTVLLSLKSDDAGIQADGSAFTYIRAELPLDAQDAKSNVVFTTTKGTFDNNSKSITQTATVINDNGTNKRIAKVKLTSSQLIETSTITATIGNISKTVDVAFNNLPYDTFLNVTTSASSIPADGASFTYINIDQPLNLVSDYTSITFTATTGQFDNGSKTITKSSSTVLVGSNYKRTAQVRFTASKTEETANIEVAVKGTSKNVSINFIKAYAENLKLSVSAPAISAGYGNNITITTSLIRTIGTPSVNNEASLTAIDASGISHGSFINYTTKSDVSGTITNKFTMGNDTYKGPLTLIATGKDAGGKPITDQLTIITQ